MRLICLLIGLAGPLTAQTCPDPIDAIGPTADLSKSANAARTLTEADDVTRQMWALWTQAPDTRAQMLLDDGMMRIRSFDLSGAITVLGELIDYCPAYAEGWNQRAFALYLQSDFAEALADLDAALERTPNHVGALSGKALTLMGLGQADAAQEVLRDAVRLNPWIPERHMLARPLGEEL